MFLAQAAVQTAVSPAVLLLAVAAVPGVLFVLRVLMLAHVLAVEAVRAVAAPLVEALLAAAAAPGVLFVLQVPILALLLGVEAVRAAHIERMSKAGPWCLQLKRPVLAVAALAVLRLALRRLALLLAVVLAAAVALAGVVQVIVAAEVEAAAPVSPDWVAQRLVTVQGLAVAAAAKSKGKAQLPAREAVLALWFPGAVAVLAAVCLTMNMSGCAPKTASRWRLALALWKNSGAMDLNSEAPFVLNLDGMHVVFDRVWKNIKIQKIGRAEMHGLKKQIASGRFLRSFRGQANVVLQKSKSACVRSYDRSFS
jgi:hypothetical protein